MHLEALRQVVLDAIDDRKGVDVKCLDVREMTDVVDEMIVATGTSARHVRSIVDRVVERCAERDHRPLGIEGREHGEWVLIDLVDIAVHVMLPAARDLYGIERLWGAPDFADFHSVTS